MYVIKGKFFSIGDDFDVEDEHGTKVFHVDGKVFSLRDKVVVEDPHGEELASVHRHLISLRPTYEIRIGGETAAEVKKKCWPWTWRWTARRRSTTRGSARTRSEPHDGLRASMRTARCRSTR